MAIETRATAAVAAAGIPHEVIEYGRVASVAEAAKRRGVTVNQIVKSLVVRVGTDRHVMVLVPGDRVIDWPRLRAHLGINRMSLAPTEEAFEVTGYRRGAITPFGSIRSLPVVCDEQVPEHVSIGGGAHGVAIHLARRDLVAVTGATVAGVTKPG